jgi:hypothetical protein
MRDLEQTLLQIGRELEWPETPDLESRVTATLRATAAGVAEHPAPDSERAAPGAGPGAERPAPGPEHPAPGPEHPAPGAEHPAPGPEHPAPGAERRLREPEADKVDGRRAGERRRRLRAGERRRGLRAADRRLRAGGPRLVLHGLLPPRGLRRALVIAVVWLLVLAGAVFAAVPSVRDAVLDFIGLQGATVEQREELPPAPPIEPLDLGTRTTLDDAGERLAFDPLVPADPGEPDGVYVSRRAPGGELSLTYRPREGLPRARTTGLGLLVTEIRGDLVPDLFGKLAGPDASIEELTVGGEPAAWIEGAEHFFFYRGPGGRILENELRLAQNVLLMQRGPMLIRLEGAFDRDRAVEIASSLR